MSDPLEVWSIRDPIDRNTKSFWKHAGRAFINQDGSINVLLDVLPIEGKLQIRKRTEVGQRNGVDRAGTATGHEASSPAGRPS